MTTPAGSGAERGPDRAAPLAHAVRVRRSVSCAAAEFTQACADWRWMRLRR